LRRRLGEHEDGRSTWKGGGVEWDVGCSSKDGHVLDEAECVYERPVKYAEL
jgi:hypothetical protein